ncbi:AAA family ATPase [Acetivibrio cellulolyticus]|uniref:AAA family ATPase n=1 Tax=Acetivibrio cellulolyticus TaxID=35830 RepID=UPI0001E2C2BE|nr:AAA family ATPase [Acetivibrio cellulolyticus]
MIKEYNQKIGYCPTEPDWSINWEQLYGQFSWLKSMEGTLQDPVFHAEGDVLTHTKKVCESLTHLEEWRRLEEPSRFVLFAAALLHDIAKPICTRVDSDDHFSSKGHALKGELIAREIIYKNQGFNYKIPFEVREMIVKLVRYHGLPLFFLEKDNPVRSVIEASQSIPMDWLALLAKSDALGRICPDQNELLERIVLFSEFCEEQGCYRGARKFADAFSRFKYFQKEDGNPDYAAFDDTDFTVILMSGLPASGKDTFIEKNYRGLEVISLDRIRDELDVSPEEDQGYVVQTAKEMARKMLRKHKPFIWNATNLTKNTRRQLISLFTSYGAKVKLIYLEAPYLEILRRNRERSRNVPEKVIERMVKKLEVPDITEAHEVKWITC